MASSVAVAGQDSPFRSAQRVAARFTQLAVVDDLTGDGRPDVVGVYDSGELYALPGTARGTLGAPRRLGQVVDPASLLG